eukprot:8733863-Alexandrium_andersonii.AAC.1
MRAPARSVRDGARSSSLRWPRLNQRATAVAGNAPAVRHGGGKGWPRRRTSWPASRLAPRATGQGPAGEDRRSWS